MWGLATSRVEKIQKANVTKACQKLAKYWINVGDSERQSESERKTEMQWERVGQLKPV